MTRRIFTISTLTLALSISVMAQAPSIDGKWSATIQGRGGNAPTERIYTIKQTGMTFTGSYAGFQGNEVQMTNGKIDAAGKIEFTVTQAGRGGGAPVEIKYTGEVAGDTLKFAPVPPPAPPAGTDPAAAPQGRGGGRGGFGGGPVEAKRVK